MMISSLQIIYDGLENRKIEIEKLKILGYSIIDGAVDCSGIQAVDENQLRLNNEIINLKTKVYIYLFNYQ